ncbi:MAG: hypothetical protein AAGD43_03865 [Pseudomonadota bacterium]
MRLISLIFLIGTPAISFSVAAETPATFKHSTNTTLELWLEDRVPTNQLDAAAASLRFAQKTKDVSPDGAKNRVAKDGGPNGFVLEGDPTALKQLAKSLSDKTICGSDEFSFRSCIADGGSLKKCAKHLVFCADEKTDGQRSNPKTQGVVLRKVSIGITVGPPDDDDPPTVPNPDKVAPDHQIEVRLIGSTTAQPLKFMKLKDNSAKIIKGSNQSTVIGLTRRKTAKALDYNAIVFMPPGQKAIATIPGIPSKQRYQVRNLPKRNGFVLQWKAKPN